MLFNSLGLSLVLVLAVKCSSLLHCSTWSVTHFLFFFLAICDSVLTSCVLALTRFLQHFALSSISQEPILFDHLGVLFPSAELKNPVKGQGDKVSSGSSSFASDKELFPLRPPRLILVPQITLISDVGFFNVWKGCHYHHHGSAGKP